MSNSARLILLLCVNLEQAQAVRLIKFSRESSILEYNVADFMLIALGAELDD